MRSLLQNKLTIASAMLTAAALVAGAEAATPREPQPIPADQFDRLHKMIKPQPGESRFMEIPWLLSVWEARQKAAAEGKPMLVWAGGWGVPIGTC